MSWIWIEIGQEASEIAKEQSGYSSLGHPVLKVSGQETFLSLRLFHLISSFNLDLIEFPG